MSIPFRDGCEVELLYFPTSYEYAAMTNYLTMVGAIPPGKTFTHEEARPIIRKHLSSRFRDYQFVADGDLEEIVLPPYTLDEFEEQRVNLNILFKFLNQYGYKIHGEQPIGTHHTIDLSLFNQATFRYFFQCVFTLRKALYIIANRNGRNTRKSDLVYALGDIHKYHTEEEHWKMFNTSLELIMDSFNKKTHLNLLGITLYPTIGDVVKPVLQMEWFNSVIDFTELKVQIEFIHSILDYSAEYTESSLSTYKEFIGQSVKYEKVHLMLLEKI
jgi:hypothetical protein